MNNNNFTKIAVLDFDGTLIDDQSQKLLLRYFFKKGHLKLIKYFIIMCWFILFKFNFVKSTKSIFEYAITCIKNKRVSEIDSIFEDFFNQICIKHFYENSFNLIKYLKDNGFYIIIMSTAIDPIILRASKYLVIDDTICTKLEIINDKYTGKILGEPIFGVNKAKALKQYLVKNNFNSKKVFVFADHITDLDLFMSVDNQIMVNPSTKLLTCSLTKKWPMIYLSDNESFQYFKSNTKF